MADQFTKNSSSSSSRSSSVIRNSSCRSVKKSLSPPLLNCQAQVPPCIWDVEYPRQSINQPLRRSFSERSRPSKIFKPSVSSSVVRSLWNAENKEYLEMRFGLLMRKEQGGESCCSSSSSSSTFFDSSSISPGKPMIQKQQQDLDASASSEEASSIFSHPDCSSFSSGSDDFSSVRDEPAVAEEEQRKQEARKEDEEAFLDYALEQGNLVDNPRAVTRTNEHPAKRHNVVSLQALEESPRRKLYSPSPPKRSIRPSFANDDRYPMLIGNSGRHLMRSYTAKPTTMKLLDSAVDQEPKAPVARRLISSTDQQQQQFSPGRFPKPKISEEMTDESASTGTPQSQPLNQSVSSQPAQAQDQDEEPEVHCRSFFLKRPTSFIRHRKRGKDSPTIRASDGYQTAHLHCAVRHDHHSYTFVVDGCEDLLLVARAPRIKCADAKDEEVEICSFYSRKQRRRPKATRSLSWKKPAWPISSAAAASESNPESSEILARMKLSRRFSRGQHAAVDLEYVMFDATTERSQQQQQQLGFEDDARLSFKSWEARKSSPQSSTSSASSVLVNQNSKRSWWSLVPGSPVLRRKSSKNLSSPSRGKIDEDVDVLTEIWKQMEAAESLRREQAARRLQELAAFVITVHSRKNHHQIQQEISPQHVRNNSFDCLPGPREIKNTSSSAIDVTVVLPIGDHGMPSGSDAGPSPLINRWRTGSCDCGGWDVGCALNVLRRDPEESQSNLLEISLQGAAKQDEDVFSLVGLSNGLFSIRFKEPLSALQAFGAAVAILYRNPNNNAVTSSALARDLEMNVNAAQEWSKVLGLPCSASGGRSQQLLHLERL